MGKVKKRQINAEQTAVEARNLSDTNKEVVSSKTQEKIKRNVKEPPAKKVLSKTKRKKLELVLARRKKKADRSSVLGKLETLPSFSGAHFTNVTSLSQRKPKSVKNRPLPNSTSLDDSPPSSSDSDAGEVEAGN